MAELIKQQATSMLVALYYSYSGDLLNTPHGLNAGKRLAYTRDLIRYELVTRGILPHGYSCTRIESSVRIAI